MNKSMIRKAFADSILEEAKKNQDIILVCSDSRGSALVSNFAVELPEQFVEMGIAEQNAVTVAAGLASVGKKVIVTGPASFYSMRSAEQIKVDVAYSNNNVKIVGISGGISYGALGATHHSLQDLALMRAIPNLNVIVPSDAEQMRAIVKTMIIDETPAYIRIGREATPDLYEKNMSVQIGKAIKWFEGRDIAIIACGQMVSHAIIAAEKLRKEGIYATVLDMFTIKPLDQKAIIEAAQFCGCLLTVEEHSIYGGLGSAVAEVIAEHFPVPVKILGLPDKDVPNGKDQEVFKALELDSDGIVKAAKGCLLRKQK